MAPPVCSSFLRVLPNYMHVVYQWEVFVAEGLWSGRVAGLVGRRRSLAGGAGLSTFPGWVRPVPLCVGAGPGDSRRPPQGGQGATGTPPRPTGAS